jgi:hypothetical protein
VAGSSDAEAAAELAELFCRAASRRVDRLFHDLWYNDDVASYQLAQKVLDGRYTFAEEGIMDTSEES